ncbi:MAG: hypothetical protein ACYTHJ_11285, partial [Planctomycetota bacterium]
MRASNGFCIRAACVGVMAFAAVASAAQIDVVPIRSSGGAVGNGDSISVNPGDQVEVEVRVSGF